MAIEAYGATSGSSGELFKGLGGSRRMRPCLTLRAVAVPIALAVLLPSLNAQQAPPPAPNRALLDTYCVTCHNQRAKTAGLTFDTMDLSHAGADAAVWERAVRKLRGGMMPPPGSKRPDQAA